MKIYQSDAEAALQLTAEQRKAAEELKARRPEVMPGTRAILNREEAKKWYDEVSQKMKETGAKTQAAVNAFCDLAGVPK